MNTTVIEERLAQSERLRMAGTVKEANEQLQLAVLELDKSKPSSWTAEELDCAFRVLSAQARMFALQHNPEGLLTVSIKILALPEPANCDSTPTYRAFGYMQRGVAFVQMDKYSEAISDFSQAFDLYQETKNKAGMANNLRYQGMLFIRIADFAKALSCMQQSLVLFEELDDQIGLANTYSSMADTFSDLQRHAEAMKYYQKSLAILKASDNKHLLSSLLCNMGVLHRICLEHDKAIAVYEEALAMYRELNMKIGVANVLGNIGNVYYDTERFELALDYFQQSLDLHREVKNKIGVATRTGCIGLVYSNQKYIQRDATVAEKYLKEALHLFEEIDRKKEVYEAHENLAALYKAEKRWEEMAKHFEQFHYLREEVQTQESGKKAELLLLQHQQAEREKEIAIEQAAAKAEYEASQTLLFNMMPKQIASRILHGEKEIADNCEAVSIFFSDIVGFTTLSQRVSPQELVNILNQIFTEFDHLTHKHGLEKIKTIGDSYMAVAGVPTPQANHAERAALFALDVIGAMRVFRKRTGLELELRAGLHCGQAVAGIIGENKFSYDLWGDTVNTASRMESHGEPRKIHVSDTFRQALQHTSFQFTERGEIEVKGKGKMKTYFLERLL